MLETYHLTYFLMILNLYCRLHRTKFNVFLLQLLHFKLVSIFVSSVSILVPICIAGNCTIITWFNAASLHIFDALLYTCFGCRAVCSPLKPVYRYDDNRYMQSVLFFLTTCIVVHASGVSAGV